MATAGRMGIAALCVGCALLVGCGQKGPLFLPPASTAPSGPAPASAVTPATSTPGQSSPTR
ncbi:LPS translocon maturation chaperone LptM [Hydrogenophaga sp.]|uniref:LPS translocon maturation chaperone LptM n=1 Tax=Hydrogenophaga sp. TaxID=1904254 RepID=UPI00286E63D3|nr:lipoprotein [Hydrogenophaga sp.]